KFGKAAWNKAHLDRNPFRFVKPIKTPEPGTRWLNDIEVERLLAAARESNQPFLPAMIVVALATGLREQNVFKLRRSEVNFETGLITVVAKGSRYHTVEISPELEEVLKSIPDNGTDYFFVNPRTGRPFVKPDKAWVNAKRKAGISLRWHDLRHTAATKLLREIGNIYLVQAFLGHTNSSMTQRYAKIFPPQKREAVSRMWDNVKLTSNTSQTHHDTETT
ncbi:MAG TPA: site-specific integrase, partial [Desulfomonilaceae bacterium]|nr:site-specific integrase [Desulfomonilaceae bacterium]